MRHFFQFLSLISFCVYAAETPFDLIRPVFPMKWDTASVDKGGTVASFSSFKGNPKKQGVVPAVGTVPEAFAPNAFVPDTLDQAFLDARNMRIGRIRVNQAGYLASDPEKHFFYVDLDNKCNLGYTVVDVDGKEIAKGGTLVSTGLSTESSWFVDAGIDSAIPENGRYQVSTTGPKGTVCVGSLGNLILPYNKRLRVKIVNEYSSSFIIDENVYSMVRDASLKFLGVNRSGNSESWFHGPSHTKDGAGSFVFGTDAVTDFNSQEGALQGGWYDCGDHLKESQTQAFAFMVLAVMHASNPGKDNDNYGYNHNEVDNTDGVPDVLREAKHGADFFMRSYRFAHGVVDNMAVSVGNFGADHGWWGRPENQDVLPTTLTGRGGPHERDIRLGELGSNISGMIAAGLAILSKDYAPYDKSFADSCLIVAQKMYDFAKNLKLKEKDLGPGTYDGGKPYKYNTIADGWSSPAYNGNNESHDDLAIAAIALHYATFEKTGKMDYLNDAVEDRTIGTQQESSTGFFKGGWMAWSRDGMRKSSKNTSWANAYTYTLYGFYKMLLKDEKTAAKYGISNIERRQYAESVALTLGTNLTYLSQTGSGSISIPTLIGMNSNLSYGDLWYAMQTDQTWIYNRYHAGNIFEVLAYADVTKDLEGVNLPYKGVQQWHSAEMRQLGINQLNYVLGVNPWDVSFVYGIGDKNDAHPHHRASNPEGRNTPGGAYKYRPPVGGLFGGVFPGDENMWEPSSLSWQDYHISETCIDGSTMFLSSTMVLATEMEKGGAPTEISVNVRYVTTDSAMVSVMQNVAGPVYIYYANSDAKVLDKVVSDTARAKLHNILIKGLKPGETYFFKVVAVNALSEKYVTKWLVDSTSTPYYFSTPKQAVEEAVITDVALSDLTENGVLVSWKTPNGYFDSKVRWDTVNVSYDKMQWHSDVDTSGFIGFNHAVRLTDLKKRKKYYYAVKSGNTVVSKDAAGNPLTFGTLSSMNDLEVRAFLYEFAGMDFVDLNVLNNGTSPVDNLELRFYVTGRPEEIEAVSGVNNQPGSCPLLVDSDICLAYDEAGFDSYCANSNGVDISDSLRYYLRHVVPVKLEDSYNANTGEYDWYIAVPLGGTIIRPMSKIRLSMGFSSGIYQNGMCETLRTPGKKRFSKDGTDWSFRKHSVADGDPVNYDGMPVLDKDYGDIGVPPLAPYISVYRGGEYFWGYGADYNAYLTDPIPARIPVSSAASISVNNRMLLANVPGAGLKVLHVYNMKGVLLHKEIFDGVQHEFDLARFAKGMYFAKVSAGGKVQIVRTFVIR